MKRMIVICAAVCLLLTGCAGIFDSSYLYQAPHQEESSKNELNSIYAANYSELCVALKEFAQSGTKTGIVFVPQYDQSLLEADMTQAVKEVLEEDPIAAYAVESIQWELGTNSGLSAIAVDIRYIHDKVEIQKIRQVKDLDGAKEAIGEALNTYKDNVVIYIENYESVYFAQLVRDYADTHPQTVMEMPQLAVNVYPREDATSVVVEIKFAYQNSRNAMQNMQEQVRMVFRSAVLYVSGDAEDNQKYSQLYSFLMERYDYKIETSITPSYSLLRYGVGDAKAFAVVYAAMCTDAGLNCKVVPGARDGEPWYWNFVEDAGRYYYVDLLRCSSEGAFVEMTQEQMENYVWDYSAYPTNPPEEPVETQPIETQPTQTTAPAEE